MPLPLIALAIAAFGISTTECVIMGLLPDVACDLGVSIPSARVITAFCHGACFGIGSVAAAGLVAPNRRAQAIALMFIGLTLANVLGVPLSTALGQTAGWRAPFGAVTLIGALAAAALAGWLPAKIRMQRTTLALAIFSFTMKIPAAAMATVCVWGILSFAVRTASSNATRANRLVVRHRTPCAGMLNAILIATGPGVTLNTPADAAPS